MTVFHIFEPAAYSDAHTMLDPDGTNFGHGVIGDGFRFVDLTRVSSVEVSGATIDDAGTGLSAGYTDHMGRNYSPGDVIEANYEFILRDAATGHLFRVTQLTIADVFVGAAVSPAWDPTVGAFVAGPGSLPPTDRDLTLVDGDALDDTPNITQFRTDNNYTHGNAYGNDTLLSHANGVLVCFDAATPVVTPGGPVAIGALRPGALVETLDLGPQPVLWVERRVVPLAASLADDRRRWVEIAPGALEALGGRGPAAPLRVTRQHRLLLGDMLVAARRLVGRPGIALGPPARMECVHVLTPRHALIDAAGAWAETLLPGPLALAGLTPAGRAAAAAACADPARPIADGQALRRMLKARSALDRVAAL